MQYFAVPSENCEIFKELNCTQIVFYMGTTLEYFLWSWLMGRLPMSTNNKLLFGKRDKKKIPDCSHTWIFKIFLPVFSRLFYLFFDSYNFWRAFGTLIVCIGRRRLFCLTFFRMFGQFKGNILHIILFYRGQKTFHKRNSNRLIFCNLGLNSEKRLLVSYAFKTNSLPVMLIRNFSHLESKQTLQSSLILYCILLIFASLFLYPCISRTFWNLLFIWSKKAKK